MNIKKLLSMLCAVSLMSNIITIPAFAGEIPGAAIANTQESVSIESEFLQPTSAEMIQELDEAACMFDDGLISQAEFDAMLLDIYQIDTAAQASGSYYPKVQAGYINYEGVKFLYEYAMTITNSAQAAISLLLTKSNVGWGLSFVSTISALSGKSELQRAVDEAYYAKKGIIVYYEIHKSVQSYNRVTYVVG